MYVVCIGIINKNKYVKFVFIISLDVRKKKEKYK